MHIDTATEARLASRDPFRSFLAGPGPSLAVAAAGDHLEVRRDGVAAARFDLDADAGRLTAIALPETAAHAAAAVIAAAEAVLAWHPQLAEIALDGAVPPALLRCLGEDGVAILEAGGARILPAMLMQISRPWTGRAGAPYPQRHVMTGDRRHPLRPGKPTGPVYARFIPWLGRSVRFRAATVEDDLPLLHRWMNDPRIDAFWNEAGSLEHHRDYLARLVADPHMLPLIGSFDDAPFGYFELYWAKENRLAPFYDAGDHDRGWHVVVGEDAFRGRDFISAWLPSLMHYMFLDDARTQRIVGEPAAAHHQQLRNLERSGFARIKNFSFPHKRATLVTLLRERFFEDRLWLPAAAAPVGAAA
jgi:RimJ/RimL family protein N-acetyltransferase